MNEYTTIMEEVGKTVKELQKGCLHSEISDWMEYYREPGHIKGEVRYCLRCGLKVSGRGFGSNKRIEISEERAKELIKHLVDHELLIAINWPDFTGLQEVFIEVVGRKAKGHSK